MCLWTCGAGRCKAKGVSQWGGRKAHSLPPAFLLEKSWRHAQTRASLNFPQAVPFDASHDHIAVTSGATAQLTLAAVTDCPNILRQIWASYSATPAAGTYVQVEDGSGTVIWKQSVVGAGPFQFTFDPAKAGSTNTAMSITLFGGGGTVVAYLDVNAYVQN